MSETSLPAESAAVALADVPAAMTTTAEAPPAAAALAPPSTAQAPARKAGKARGARETHPLLQRLWQLHPKLFGARFVPLKLGVFEDLMTRHAGEFDKAELKAALGQHVRSTRYLLAVAEGLARHDLDGQPVDAVAPEHVQHAILEVLRRRQGKDTGAEQQDKQNKQDKARDWARACLVRAIEAAGLASSRQEWLERVHTQDDTALALLDEAYGELAERAARHEALRRAFEASGASVEAFAEMYGMDAQQVRQAVATQG